MNSSEGLGARGRLPRTKKSRPRRRDGGIEADNRLLRPRNEIDGGGSSGEDASDVDNIRHDRFDASIVGNRYEELKPIREAERLKAIRQGVIDDPDKPKQLEHALTFVGTCPDMCPEFEREQREFQKNVERWEINPATGRIDKDLAVKAFHRPAAGLEQALPSDVRPPVVLSGTLDYLIANIIGGNNPLESVHGFVRDRTRSIRQDFTLQNSRGSEAIQAHERIARFHILCLHHLCEVKDFSVQQEMEQLRKVLQSLTEFYEDARMEKRDSPNEAEFRAYHILCHLRDQDMERQAQMLPPRIFSSDLVQLALSFFALAQKNNEQTTGNLKHVNCEATQNFFTKFFSLLGGSKTNYLSACILETQFSEVRKGALKAIRRAYLPAHKAIPADELGQWLGCDDLEEVGDICTYYGFEVEMEDGRPLDISVHKQSAFDESQPLPRQRFSYRLVESKRNEYSLADIISGVATETGRAPSLTEIKPRQASAVAPKQAAPSEIEPSLDTAADRPTGDASPWSAPLRWDHASFQTTYNEPGRREPQIQLPTFSFSSSITSNIAITHPSPSFTQSRKGASQFPTPPLKPPDINVDAEAKYLADRLLLDTVARQSHKAAREALTNLQQQNQRRGEEISRFADEIFTSLIQELCYDVCLVSVSEIFRIRTCKSAYFRKWRCHFEANLNAKIEARERQLRKQARREQYLHMIRGFRIKPSSRISADLAFEESVDDQKSAKILSEAYRSTTDLWSPEECASIFEDAFHRMRSDLDKDFEFELLMICQSIDSASSKWLMAKLGIRVGRISQATYRWERDSAILRIRVCENPTDQCGNVGAIVYNCEAGVDYGIHRDLLWEMSRRILTISLFAVSIMVITWNGRDASQLSQDLEFERLLDAADGRISAITVVDIKSLTDADLRPPLEALASHVGLRRCVTRAEKKRKRGTEQVSSTPAKRHEEYLKRHQQDLDELSTLIPNTYYSSESSPASSPDTYEREENEIIPEKVRLLRESIQAARKALST